MSCRECCVGSCKRKKPTVLFSFPRNPSLKELWVRYLAPYAPTLLNVTEKHFQDRKVCIRHFEKKFLKDEKRRYFQACPTLFTCEEIATGIPSLPVNFKNLKPDHSYSLMEICSDHNYAKRQVIEDHQKSNKKQKVHHTPDSSNIKAIESYIVSPAETNPGCSKSTPSSNVLPENEPFAVGSMIEPTPGCSKWTMHEQQKPHSSEIKKSPKRLRLVSKLNALTPRCRALYEKCKKIIHKKRLFKTKDNLKTIENSKKLANTKSFQELTKQLDHFQEKFISMQLKLAGKKKKARRYSTEEKLMCISLYKNSPKGYKLLQKLFSLPNTRTLHRVLEEINFNCGVNEQFFNAIKAKAENWHPRKKICSIVFDEVHLMSNLKFCPKSDQIYGFVSEDEEHPKFADHALVFMLRGVCESWRQPIAYYFCESAIPKLVLKDILRNIFAAVVDAGLDPIAFICDQGVTLQGALKSLQEDTRRYQLQNSLPCDDTIFLNGRTVHIVYDPPHLLKGLRNNMLSKDLLFKGKIAKWEDIIEVYNFDCGIGQIRMLPKINDEHVIPEKIRKMKVSNCSRVLSERVAATMHYTATFKHRHDGQPISSTMTNTAEAIHFMDKLFDSCNGSRGGRCPGKMRGPVSSVSGHLTFWEEAVRIIKEIKFMEKSSNEKSLKSVPTLKNWVTTLESLIKITNLLLKKKDIKYFYTRNFNQDPLENFFGKIRSHNYRFNNPDPYTFKNSFRSLLVSDVFNVHSQFSNCEEDIGAKIVSLKNILSQKKSDESHPTTLESINEPSSHRASNEVVKVSARGYTAGYIIRKLKKYIKCSLCHKTFLSDEVTSAHKLIQFREREALKGQNLCYPNTQIIVAFSKIIEFTNSYLDINCHKKGVIKNISQMFFSQNPLQWLGCSVHHTVLKYKFIKFTASLQVFNWVKSINGLLNGSLQHKYDTSSNHSKIQEMAQKKYEKTRKIKLKH